MTKAILIIEINTKEMKHIEKLEINREKILNNDELSKLRGGGYCICHIQGHIVIAGFTQGAAECTDMCSVYGATGSYTPGSQET